MATTWQLLKFFGLRKPEVNGNEFIKKELTLEERIDLHPDINSEINNDTILYKYMEEDCFNMSKLLDDLKIPRYK